MGDSGGLLPCYSLLPLFLLLLLPTLLPVRFHLLLPHPSSSSSSSDDDDSDDDDVDSDGGEEYDDDDNYEDDDVKNGDDNEADGYDDSYLIREHHYFNFRIDNNFVDGYMLEIMIINTDIDATAKASAASDGDDDITSFEYAIKQNVNRRCPLPMCNSTCA